MGRRIRKAVYWQDAPIVREQIVLIPTTLDDRIPEDHPVRLVDSLLSKLDWTLWESYYHGAIGQPPIHPSVLCKVWIFALMRRIRSSRQVEYKQSIRSISFGSRAAEKSITRRLAISAKNTLRHSRRFFAILSKWRLI